MLSSIVGNQQLLNGTPEALPLTLGVQARAGPRALAATLLHRSVQVHQRTAAGHPNPNPNPSRSPNPNPSPNPHQANRLLFREFERGYDAAVGYLLAHEAVLLEHSHGAPFSSEPEPEPEPEP